ncbi:MAG TPA: helix-turn-helix domain-containing protein [Pyrinomonadaceae bacterium]|nr:helix-turn-helix domain-containing protein [Pyrinomonadaceae bacterium]
MSDAIMLSPEQAAAVTGIPERQIYQWVEAGAIHYKEVPNGKLIVCIKTLISLRSPPRMV